MTRAEEILMTTLAAYGLLKLLEGLVCPPRPTVIVVGESEAAAALREALDGPEAAE